MATTTTTPGGWSGQELRTARARAGLTRAQLAALAGCSLAQLANIEQGAVPKRSRVLETARTILAGLDPSTSEATGAQSDGFANTDVAASGDACPA